MAKHVLSIARETFGQSYPFKERNKQNLKFKKRKMLGKLFSFNMKIVFHLYMNGKAKKYENFPALSVHLLIE